MTVPTVRELQANLQGKGVSGALKDGKHVIAMRDFYNIVHVATKTSLEKTETLLTEMAANQADKEMLFSKLHRISLLLVNAYTAQTAGKPERALVIQNLLEEAKTDEVLAKVLSLFSVQFLITIVSITFLIPELNIGLKDAEDRGLHDYSALASLLVELPTDLRRQVLTEACATGLVSSKCNSAVFRRATPVIP
jgi:hypothetical protein